MDLKDHFAYDDGGRSTSKRSKQTKDCTVRAISIPFEIPYDEAYNFLKENGRKCSSGYELQILLNKHNKLFDKNIIRMSFPAIKGQKRMTPEKFIETFPTGTYILNQAGHMSVVVNGIVRDILSTIWGRCVYTAYHIF